MMTNTRTHARTGYTVFPHIKTNIITVWRATRRDKSAVRRMESSCFGLMRNLFGLWPRVGRPNTFVWVAGMNDMPVGYLIAYYHDLDGQPIMYVGGIGTLPQYRKQGIGTHLMQAVFAEYPQLWLHVRAGNATAIALYEKLGMRQVRRLPNFYSNGDDAITMATSNAPSTPGSEGLLSHSAG